jgi:prevent-host-death family protein
MRAVGIKELKNKLSEYVRIAASGESVLVTDRGRVVAQLTPSHTNHPALAADPKLAEAVREGWMSPPASSQKRVPPRRPVMRWEELEKDLAFSREDR